MKILVRERIADAGIDFLRRRFEVDVDFDSPLEEKIADYDAIIVRSATDVSAELIDRAERLKVIGRAGVGVDNVDVEAASRRGIVVANAPQSTIVSAAEHAFGLLLALSRNIPQAHAALKEGRWERSRFAGLELADKTLGVVGFGRIGQQVARRARAFEMDVLAHDPYVAPERFRDFGATMVESLEELLAESDFVTLHLALTDETHGLIDRTRLDGAREGIRIVNAARGELVDESALAEALRSGKVAGAALDVFSEEPYTGPLLELDNVIVTPHLVASTQGAQDRAGIIVAEQVAAALDGHLVTNAVNMPAVAAEDLEQLGPYLPLAAKLGALSVELADGNPTRLDFQYFGQLAERDTRLLTVAALNGIFQGRVDQPVNYVNAPLVARERGVEVREESSAASQDFTSLIAVTAFAGGKRHAFAGTVSGRGQRPRLVAALGYDLEVELDRLML
ncbi:MAG: phosphoglycerate dehydrogenase, partial [Gaiellaceae bacterium]